jgi:hypothetical protein
MLFISTGIFDDKLRPRILLVGTTANSPLSLIAHQDYSNDLTFQSFDLSVLDEGLPIF